MYRSVGFLSTCACYDQSIAVIYNLCPVHLRRALCGSHVNVTFVLLFTKVPVSQGMKHEQKIPFRGMADEMVSINWIVMKL